MISAGWATAAAADAVEREQSGAIGVGYSSVASVNGGALDGW